VFRGYPADFQPAQARSSISSARGMRQLAPWAAVWDGVHDEPWMISNPIVDRARRTSGGAAAVSGLSAFPTSLFTSSGSLTWDGQDRNWRRGVGVRTVA
jgi:hypothetical protein